MRIQRAVVIPVDGRNGDSWANVQGNAESPQVPLRTDTRDGRNGWDDVVDFAVGLVDFLRLEDVRGHEANGQRNHREQGRHQANVAEADN